MSKCRREARERQQEERECDGRYEGSVRDLESERKD